MYAVLGVTGNTGKVVADRLLARGASARVVVREASKGAAWAARGAEVAVADLSEVDALAAALRGVDGAYVLLPPNPVSPDFLAEQRRKLDVLTAAVRRAAVPHVVLLSSVAAQHPAGTGPIQSLHPAEAELPRVAPRTTFVRAAYFLENWAGSLGGIGDGVFPTFLRPDVPFDMVATADIGRVAADALLAGGSVGTELVELASGPTALSPRDIAAVVSRIVGRELTVAHGPQAAVVPTLTSYGMSGSVAGLYAEMIHAFNTADSDPWERSGWFVRGPTTAETVLRGLLGR
jgi:uncharacterized protein YbjT (DUF2867 family)